VPNTTITLKTAKTAELATFAGVQGEIVYDSDKNTIVVLDGAILGGNPLVKEGFEDSLGSISLSGPIVLNSTQPSIEWNQSGTIGVTPYTKTWITEARTYEGLGIHSWILGEMPLDPDPDPEGLYPIEVIASTSVPVTPAYLKTMGHKVATETWVTAQNYTLEIASGVTSVNDAVGVVTLTNSDVGALSDADVRISDWDSAYGWGDHASAGYTLEIASGVTSVNGAVGVVNLTNSDVGALPASPVAIDMTGHLTITNNAPRIYWSETGLTGGTVGDEVKDWVAVVDARKFTIREDSTNNSQNGYPLEITSGFCTDPDSGSTYDADNCEGTWTPGYLKTLGNKVATETWANSNYSRIFNSTSAPAPADIKSGDIWVDESSSSISISVKVGLTYIWIEV
jgi:hypothetical protein